MRRTSSCPDGWVPMRCHADSEEVDFAIVGAGAGGATLAARLAEKGFSVVCFDAGPYWRPLEDFASDELAQEMLYWTDSRITGGADPIALAGNNCGKGVGGSTVHFSMVSLRFRPEWFKSRSKLGYGFDWPVTYEEIAPYYDQAERALSISGPVKYPWGPPRGPYPYRPHEVNAPGLILGRAADRMGIKWCSTPLATVSAPRGKSPPCVYRGYCHYGCSTNAKQSALVVWAARAVKAGAEIRDMAMVGQVETSADGARATGVRYHREGEWRVQKAQERRGVRLRHRDAAPAAELRHAQAPERPGQQLGLRGRLSDHPVGAGRVGHVRGGHPLEQGAAQHGGDRALELHRRGQGLPRRLRLHEPGAAGARVGPEPGHLAGPLGRGPARGMADYNHTMGFVPVGEVEPRACNTVTLVDDEVDQYGLKIPKVTFSYSDNDKRLIEHSVKFMGQMLDAAGGRDQWRNDDTSHLLGTCRMGDDPRTSVVNADGRSWDVPNLWVCDGSLFATTGGVNPSLTIQALALRCADRIEALARRGEL